MGVEAGHELLATQRLANLALGSQLIAAYPSALKLVGDHDRDTKLDYRDGFKHAALDISEDVNGGGCIWE